MVMSEGRAIRESPWGALVRQNSFLQTARQPVILSGAKDLVVVSVGGLSSYMLALIVFSKHGVY